MYRPANRDGNEVYLDVAIVCFGVFSYNAVTISVQGLQSCSTMCATRPDTMHVLGLARASRVHARTPGVEATLHVEVIGLNPGQARSPEPSAGYRPEARSDV